jgi:hypothetical protein
MHEELAYALGYKRRSAAAVGVRLLTAETAAVRRVLALAAVRIDLRAQDATDDGIDTHPAPALPDG